MPERSAVSSNAVALIAGRYELVRAIASEGETVVWEGFDASLERAVSIRLLRQDMAEDGMALQRFWQAARAAARGSTEIGERVLDAGTDPETGRVFVVREWSASRDETAPVQLKPRAGTRRSAGRRVALVGLAVLVLAAGAVIVSAAQGWRAWVDEPLQLTANSTFVLPTVGPSTPMPTAAPTVAPTVAPTAASATRATPAPTQTVGVPRRIVNTDGQGVALRGSPGGARLPGHGYDEGAIVTAYETSGAWTHIRGGDGREGWVLSVTLAP